MPRSSASSACSDSASSTTAATCTVSGVSRSVPVSASEISISAVSVALTRSASSSARASPSRSAAGSCSCSVLSATLRNRVNGVRRSCATLSSASRMPRTSRSMRASIVLMLRAEPIERIAGAAGGDPRVEASGFEDRVRRGLEGAHRRQRHVADEGAAGDGDDGDDHADLDGAVAEAGEHLVADPRAASDLDDEAVRQPAGADLEGTAVDRVGDLDPGLARGAFVERRRGRSRSTPAAARSTRSPPCRSSRGPAAARGGPRSRRRRPAPRSPDRPLRW